MRVRIPLGSSTKRFIMNYNTSDGYKKKEKEIIIAAIKRKRIIFEKMLCDREENTSEKQIKKVNEHINQNFFISFIKKLFMVG